MTQAVGQEIPPKELTIGASIMGYFRGWRYELNGLLLCFLAMYLGWIALAGGFSAAGGASNAGIAAATLGATCILLAVFLINDAADRDIDRLVHPERPIPQGRAAWQHIYAAGLVLLAAALALSLFVNERFSLVSFLLSAMIVLHYGYLKRRLAIPCSSELITPVISALFPLSAFAVSRQFRVDVLLAVMAFIYFADLAHDLIGGVHDQEGDKRQNVRTFALAFGSRAALLISAACFTVALAAGLFLSSRAQLGWVYLTTFSILSAVSLFHYVRVFTVRGPGAEEVLRKANHFGGVYFFVVSGSLLPDYLLRRLLG